MKNQIALLIPLGNVSAMCKMVAIIKNNQQLKITNYNTLLLNNQYFHSRIDIIICETL